VEARTGKRLGLRGAFARAEDRYLLVLVMIVATLIAMAVAGNAVFGRALVAVIVAVTLAETLRTSGWRPRSVRLTGLIVVALVAAAGVVSAAAPADTGTAFFALIGIGLVVTAIVAIVLRLVKQPEVTMKTVLGALCIYLYAGLLFALVYGFVDLVQSDPFFVQTDDATSLEYVYFSIVTMATVGYGDYTAAGNVGRMLAVSEALYGQLYLVSVVAILVGNLGRKRPRLQEGEASQSDVTSARDARSE
jgi:hypothetical protein